MAGRAGTLLLILGAAQHAATAITRDKRDFASAAAAPCATYTPNGTRFVARAFEDWAVAQSGDGCGHLGVRPGRYHVELPASSRAHVVLTAGLSSMTMDLTEVTLVMAQRHAAAVYISNWTNVTLNGLTVQYAQVPTNQARISNVSEHASTGDLELTVEIPAGYPTEDWQPGKQIPSCNVYQGQSRFLRVGSQDLGGPVVKRVASAQQYTVRFPHVKFLDRRAVEVGDTLGCRIADGAFGMTVDGCARCTFRDITLRGAPGFGFFHTHPKSSDGSSDPRSDGNNLFQRLRLTYPEAPAPGTQPPVLSASADAFHIVGVPHGPTIESCLFEGHNDDGIALHGSYSLVVDVASQLATETSEPQAGNLVQVWVTAADYAVGNLVKFYDPAFQLAATGEVLQVGPALPNGHYAPPRNTSRTMPNKKLLPEPMTWYQVLAVRLDTATAIAFDWVVFNVERASSGFVLRNNTIRNHRARGMLIKSSNGSILNNSVANSSLGGIVVTPELSWGEGDFASNLRIQDNVITSVCTGVQCYGGLAIGATDPDHAFVGAPSYGHKNITVVGNRFINISQMNVWVSSVNGLTMHNNSVFTPYSYPPVATCCPPYPYPDALVAWATESTSVDIRNNCVFGPPPPSAGITVFNWTTTVANSSLAQGWRICPPQ